MFSGELDRLRHPLISRSRGILLGSILLVAVVAALVSARTLAFTFSITVAAFLIAAVMRRDKPAGKPWLPGAPTIYLLVLLLYALLSATWAIRPDLAAAKTLVAMAMTVGTATILALIRRETRPNLLHMGEGVCIGLFIGLVYLLVELLSDQSIKLAIYRAVGVRPDDVTASFFTWSDGKLVKISTDDLSRNMSSAALLVWPALMMTAAMWSRPRSTIYCLVLGVLTWLVVGLSWHESSKLALVVGLGAFVLAQLSLLWTRRLAVVVWFAACLAILPAVLLAHRMDLHHSSWLQLSARHRLVIWNFTAEKVLESPLVGIGVSSTYILGPQLETANPPPSDDRLPETLSTHSHNIYLQTWLELGLIGAVLLTLFGLSIITGISTLGPVLQPYAYATFASAVAMGSSSYGIWQVWYMALFALCAVSFGIGARLLSGTTLKKIEGACQKNVWRGMARKRTGRFSREQIISALRASGGIRLAAAKMLRCSPSSISNYIDRFPEIKEALADICAEKLDIAESILLKTMANEHSPALQLQAAKYYLGKLGTERGYGAAPAKPFGPKNSSNYDFSRLSAEEREVLLTLINKAYVGPDAEADGKDSK